MASVTIRVLEGLERGKVFSDLVTPLTIGREDENDIQLNDDRVSRFHAKLQEDAGRVILTDLDSTNGTRVNGHPVQVKVLQAGDLLMIGRCVLVYGDLPEWKAASADDEVGAHQTALLADDFDPHESPDFDFLGAPIRDDDPLFPRGAPVLPSDLRPLHRAQVSDMLAYLHEQVGEVLLQASQQEKGNKPQADMVCPHEAWQRLISLQITLASYLRQIANPDE